MARSILKRLPWDLIAYSFWVSTKKAESVPYLNSIEQDNTNSIQLSAPNSDTQLFAL